MTAEFKQKRSMFSPCEVFKMVLACKPRFDCRVDSPIGELERDKRIKKEDALFWEITQRGV